MLGAIVGGSLISGLLGSQAAGDQADAISDASAASVAEQRRQFNLLRGDTEPYREVGQNALYQMSNMLGLGGQDYHERTNRLSDLRDQLSDTDQHITTGGYIDTDRVRVGSHKENRWKTVQRFVPESTKLNPEYTRLEDEIADLEAQIEQSGGGPGQGGGFDVSQTPGYQFRMDQGLNALNNSLAASGNRFSGRAMKAAQRYGQGLASQEFGQHFNRLAGLSGTGQAAVQNTGQAGMNMASNVGNALMQSGMAQGNAAMQGASAWNNAIQGGIGNYLAYNQNQQLLNALGSTG